MDTNPGGISGTCICPPEIGSEMAGSLSFAVPQPVTASAVLRQALLSSEKSPPSGVEGGTMFLNAAWGEQYLLRRLKSRRSVTLARPHGICGTDAAGASHLIAAVVCCPPRLVLVRAKVPDWLCASASLAEISDRRSRGSSRMASGVVP